MTNSTGSPLAPMRCSAAPTLVPSSRPFSVRTKMQSKSQVGAYKLKGQIGEGGNASVLVGTTKTAAGGEELVAIKQTIVIGEQATDADKRAFKADAKAVKAGERAVREAHIQALCHDHPNIPTAFDLVQNSTTVFLVMELGDGGDLFDYVLEDGPLHSEEGLALFRQLASAVAHMHSLGLAHRDIKPENILLTNAHKTPMLTDFGSAIEFKRGDPLLVKATGTKRCFPPEMFLRNREHNCRQYDPFAMDVWCLGVVLFFMLSARFPFDGKDDEQTVLNILRGEVTTPLPKHTPDHVVSLLKKMLHYDRSKRATIEQVLELVEEQPLAQS